MAPKKKKTKPTANPARGFATTSMPSKARADESVHTSKNEPEAEDKNLQYAVKGTDVAHDNRRQETKNTPTDLHHLSPEELEQQLEQSELQFLTEKHGSKTRQNSSRSVSKLLTDKRVLRHQATFLFTRDWLPDALLGEMLQTIQEEEHETQYWGDRRSKDSSLAEEDFMVKLWSLRETLLQAGFHLEDIERTLKLLVNSPSSGGSDAQLWGLTEAFERLAIHCDDDALPSYAQELTKQSDGSRSSSWPGEHVQSSNFHESSSNKSRHL